MSPGLFAIISSIFSISFAKLTRSFPAAHFPGMPDFSGILLSFAAVAASENSL